MTLRSRSSCFKAAVSAETLSGIMNPGKLVRINVVTVQICGVKSTLQMIFNASASSFSILFLTKKKTRLKPSLYLEQIFDKDFSTSSFGKTVSPIPIVSTMVT